MDIESLKQAIIDQTGIGGASMTDEAARAALITIQSASESETLELARQFGIYSDDDTHTRGRR